MRNPNGYGSVYKLSGKRRNPFMASKTIGWTDDGNPVRKAIGYYPDRKSALMALAAFNQSPYDLINKNITFSELYEIFKKRKK